MKKKQHLKKFSSKIIQFIQNEIQSFFKVGRRTENELDQDEIRTG